MTRQHEQNNRRSATRAARRRRAWAAGTSAGALMAFGAGAWTTIPNAHADDIDLMLEPIVSTLAGSTGALADPLTTLGVAAALDPLGAVADPSAALDFGSLGLPATEAAAAGGLSRSRRARDRRRGIGG